MNTIEKLLSEIEIPALYEVRQLFSDEAIPDIKGHIFNEINKPSIRSRIKEGMKIGITAGSRGIGNYPLILSTVVDCVRQLGAIPYIVVAMGSHGEATSEGQLQLLHNLGIKEETIGAKFLSSMEVVLLGKTEKNVPVWFSKNAMEMDATILVNRIKIHTAFHGKIESGVVKMGVVGLGKQSGAECFHSLGMEHMGANLVEMGSIMLSNSNVIFGIAITENSYESTSRIEAIPVEEILKRESELLEQVKKEFPSLPSKEIDVLIVDRIGKNISGDGADPNVTGRFYAPTIETDIHVQRLVYLDLTEESHGNAIGLGVADYITQRLFKKIDFPSMYVNALTNCVVPPTKIPIIMESDEQAIKAAIRTLLNSDKTNPRIIRIKDTLHLDQIWVSQAIKDELKDNASVIIDNKPTTIIFDENGEITF